MSIKLKAVIGVFLSATLIVILNLVIPRFANRWDFLNDKTCTPPCLDNIIPGITTQADALKIVSTNKVFGVCSLEDLNNRGGSTYIDCQSYKRSVNITLVDDKVDGIGIRPYPNYTLKAIFERLGNPNWISCGFVNLPDNPKRVKPILWFDEYSTSVFLPEIVGDKCTLSPTHEIEFVVYNSVNNYYENKRSAERLKDIIPWEGFIKYTGKDLP